MAVEWTKEQRQVIELRNRNILVSAAAGSGKTAVLVERIIKRITDEEKEQRFSFEMRLSNPRTMGDTYEIIIENELSSRKKQIIFSDSNIRTISVDKTVFSTPNILNLNNFVCEVENYFGIQFNFEKIAYLSVSKGINKKQIEKWVKNKFMI